MIEALRTLTQRFQTTAVLTYRLKVVRSSRVWRFASLVVVAAGLILIAASSGFAQLRPEPEALAAATPELVKRLQTTAFDYFRFVNRPWIARVCEVFGEDLRDFSNVRLHGDAHVEQFALTSDAWGLDDFDDSARGPALVDIVRFLGSIDLAARQRGWTRDRDALVDRFFEGYRQGLSEPDFRPPEPAIVGRLRVKTPRSRPEFLAWGEKQMVPMSNEALRAVVLSAQAFSASLRVKRPELPPGYFNVVRAGWLRIGVGSAVNPKILIRVQGPTSGPGDDELVEAKEVTYLGNLRCLEARASEPTLRVVDGAKQLGRIKHKVLAAAPEFPIPELASRGRKQRDWWIHSWEPSYREVRLNDLQSVRDLAAIAYDAGIQLGAGGLLDLPEGQAEARTRALAAIARLEPRIRQETSRLVEQLLLGWQELRRR
jgi:Uncharacterized protein conserved in bacteria (DUF2252)